MWLVILLLLAFVGVLVLLTRLSSKLMGGIVGKAVNDRHRAAQFILETGKVPPAWTRSRIDDLDLDGGRMPEAISRRNRERFRAQVVRRLDALARFFERSPLFEDAEARDLLLGSLRKAREEWERSEMSSLIARDPR